MTPKPQQNINQGTREVKEIQATKPLSAVDLRIAELRHKNSYATSEIESMELFTLIAEKERNMYKPHLPKNIPDVNV